MILSFYKQCEGGQSQRDVLEALRGAGIKAERASSPYVGQTAVRILSENKRVIRRAERIVFGD